MATFESFQPGDRVITLRDIPLYERGLTTVVLGVQPNSTGKRGRVIQCHTKTRHIDVLFPTIVGAVGRFRADELEHESIIETLAELA